MISYEKVSRDSVGIYIFMYAYYWHCNFSAKGKGKAKQDAIISDAEENVFLDRKSSSRYVQ